MRLRWDRDRKGQAVVEYALLLAGISLILAVTVSVLGYKTSGLIASMATTLPSAATAANGPTSSGHLIEVTPNALGGIALDVNMIFSDAGSPRLGQNVLGDAAPMANFGALVLGNGP